MQDIKTYIIDELESLGIEATVQLDSEFISTKTDCMFIFFKDIHNLNFYKLLGKYKEAYNIHFESFY